MIEIRELAPGQLAEAADFAAQQFGCDISAAQPKLYGPRAAPMGLLYRAKWRVCCLCMG